MDTGWRLYDTTTQKVLSFQRMLLLLVFLISAIGAEEFWTTTEVLSVEWKDDCLTTATCAKPRFQIFVNLVTANEHQQASWPVFEELPGRRLASHWNAGSAEDVVVSSQVVGIDSEFSFPRVCDQTVAVRAFAVKPIEFDVIETPVYQPELVEKTVTLSARCFNATILLRKYTSRCPWCHEESHQEKSVMTIGKEQYFVFGLIVLCIIAVFSSIACVLSLVICRRSDSRDSTYISSTPLSTPGRKNTVIIPDSRLPSPPSFASPQPPSLDYAPASTVLIYDDNYDHISPNSTIYSAKSDRIYV